MNSRAICSRETQFGAAVFEHGILQMFVVLALRACIHAEFHTASVSRHHLMLDEVFLFIQAHLTEELTLERLEKEFFVSREHIAREFKRQTGQTVHRYIVKARLDRCTATCREGTTLKLFSRSVSASESCASVWGDSCTRISSSGP